MVRLEMQADYIIADHVRRDCPPGSLSYTFVEAAIRDAALPNPDDHRAGPAPGTKREVGSTAIPAKGTRTPFTAEDDRVLWEWVEGCRLRGGMVKGNEIYKALEDQNARHTFQAWRDRYIKRLMDRPPPPGAKIPADDPEQDDEEVEETPDRTANGGVSARLGNDFTDDDFEMLKKEVHQILLIQEDQVGEAWDAFADAYPEHSAEDWRTFYEEVVLPAYQEEEAEQAAKASNKGKGKEVDVREKAATVKPAVKREPSLKGRGDSEIRTTPVPASATKRKRDEPTPRSKAYGSKRVKPSNANMSDEDEQGQPTGGQRIAASEHVPLQVSGVPVRAQHVVDLSESQEDEELANNDRESKGRNRQTPSASAAADGLTTSSVNRAAQAQLIAEGSRLDEADEEPLPQVTMQVQANDMLPTSEANRAAREQLVVEASQPDREPMIQGHAASKNVDHVDSTAQNISAPARAAFDPATAIPIDQEDVAPTSDEQTPGFPLNQPEDGLIGLYDLIPPRGLELTEANLASQQEQHKPEVSRGKDLPEDDENQDQGDYAEYLQKLMGIKPATDPKPGAGGVVEVPDRLMDTPEEQEDDLVELESDRELSSEPEADDADAPPPDSDCVEFRQTSHAEIEDVFTQNMDWPTSPAKEARPRRNPQETQSQAFETQINYPTLPFPGQVDAEDDLPSSQPFKPSKPQALKPKAFEGQEPQEVPEMDDDAQVDQSSNIDLTVTEPNDEMVDDEDGDIDLTIPEPEGGFDFSSQEERTDAKPSIDAVMQDGSTSLRSQKGLTVEQVDISSDESSSSDISEEEEPVQVPNSSISTRQPARMLDTQAIVDVESQPMDFAIPLPDDSDGDELPSNPLQALPAPVPQPKVKDGKAPSPLDDMPRVKPRRSTASRRSTNITPRAQKSVTPKARPQPAEEPEDDLNTFIYRLKSRGYAEMNIANALHSTSMRTKLAEIVLIEEKRGKKVTEIPGIWSKEEDDTALGGDARKIAAVSKKHGWEEFQNRIEFLQRWNEG